VNVDQARAAILAAVPRGFERTAAAYIADRCFAPGDILSLDRQPFTVDREIMPASVFCVTAQMMESKYGRYRFRRS